MKTAADLHPAISTLSLNVYGLNTLTERQIVSKVRCRRKTAEELG